MTGRIELKKFFFCEQEQVFFQNDEFKVVLFKYPSGIEALRIENTRGKVTVLPFMGQMIWDLSFDGISLRMKNMFQQPYPVKEVVDTYGCFAFHSGLLANGCPSPEDNHILHGEMPCASMDEAWLVINDKEISIQGMTEYVKGFGHHYIAKPSVSLAEKATKINISLRVENKASVEMPLQYMCHMNYAFVKNGEFISNLPPQAFKLRESIPGHVHPTPQWLQYNESIKAMQKEGKSLTKLEMEDMYDPEIVFMADHVSQYTDKVRVELKAEEGYSFVTEFSSAEFDYATRWILYNPDQQVAAFVLPGTCRPEGFLAAKKAGSLIWLQPGEVKEFSVRTGMEQIK